MARARRFAKARTFPLSWKAPVNIMSQPKRILFPVDYSNACRAAAPAVQLWARQFQAEVTVLHASETPREEAVLREFISTAFPGFAVNEVLAQAKPAAAILERRPDLIMMPTRGQMGFRAMVMGSVTMSVLHDAGCPVWTTAHAEEAAGQTECRRVLCAVDLSPHSLEALRWMRMVKDSFGADCRVVHSVPAVDARFDSAAAERAHHFLIWDANDKYPAMAKEAGVTEPLEILQKAGVAESIAKEAESYGADLLIIGRGGVQGVLGRLRSTAQDLIRTSPCPVLSV